MIANSATSIDNTTATFFIANWDDASARRYMGLMDEVRVYNYARTSGQISGDYNQELVSGTTDPVAYYPFESLGGSGRTVIGQARVAVSGRVASGARTVHPGRTAV